MVSWALVIGAIIAEWIGGNKVDGTDANVIAETTMDQVAAKVFAKETQLASLELGIESADMLGTCDSTSCALTNTISWSNPKTPLPVDNDPRSVFERLFGDGSSPEQRRKWKQMEGSILDSVVKESGGLLKGLGPRDRARVDEYLDDIREIERRIQRAEQQACFTHRDGVSDGPLHEGATKPGALCEWQSVNAAQLDIAGMRVDRQVGRGQDAIADRGGADRMFGERDDAAGIADPCREGRRRAVFRDVRDDVGAIEDAGEGRIVLHWRGLVEPESLPPLFGELLMRASIADQFEGMVREIERREREARDAERGGARREAAP